ncbi:MAG: hypothetical protein ACKO2P_21750 [Planctomycetota bacterium]
MFFALQYHVVRSQSGVRVLPRTPQHSLALAFSDVRTWTPSQWTDRLDLARAAMAAGATDLIADSVRVPLEEEVSDSAATLNELRGFLNRSRDERSQTPDDRRLFGNRLSPAPVTIASRPESPNTRSDGLDEDSLDLDHEDPVMPREGMIPMPPELQGTSSALADARTDRRSTAPADPFRSSPAPTSGSAPTPSPSLPATAVPRPSRFSDTDVRDGLAAGAASAASRLLREAEEVERRIFGDVSGKPNSPLQPFAASGNQAAAELEQSARQLLEQVRNATTGQPMAGRPGSATTGGKLTDADAPWVRTPATAGQMPATAGALPPSVPPATPDPAADEEEPGLSFDPFLEAEARSGS